MHRPKPLDRKRPTRRYQKQALGRRKQRPHLLGIPGIVGHDNRPLVVQNRKVNMAQRRQVVGQLDLRLKAPDHMLDRLSRADAPVAPPAQLQ